MLLLPYLIEHIKICAVQFPFVIYQLIDCVVLVFCCIYYLMQTAILPELPVIVLLIRLTVFLNPDIVYILPLLKHLIVHIFGLTGLNYFPE